MKPPWPNKIGPSLTPGAGPPPHADGQLVYVVGDVHGCYGVMLELLAQVARDSRERAYGRQPVLVFCGDYVDRGPDSAKVIEVLIQLRRRTDFDVRLLKGNHEQAMLDFLRDPVATEAWLGFGGVETLASYGVMLDALPLKGRLKAARDALLEALPAAHLNMLHQLDLMLVVGDYAIVHAGVRPGVDLEEQDEEDLLWIREEFIEGTWKGEKIIVHGHTWFDSHPQLEARRIGVDTGAYETGVLTALRLDGHDIAFLQAGRAAIADARTPAD